MDIIELREFCLSLPHTEETTPFGGLTLVYKVGGKMFALLDADDTGWINLKCDPETAMALREQYSDVTPGWHMNKKHWNTIRTDSDLPSELIRQWITDSYGLVVDSLPRKVRESMALITDNED